MIARTLPSDALYQQLDHAEVARIVRECIRQMQEITGEDGKKPTYSSIAKKINYFNRNKTDSKIIVTDEAIKTFVNRPNLQRINSNNKTLRAIYNCNCSPPVRYWVRRLV